MKVEEKLLVTHDFQASSVVLGLSLADLAAEKSHCPFLSTPLRSQRDSVPNDNVCDEQGRREERRLRALRETAGERRDGEGRGVYTRALPDNAESPF